MAAAKLQLDQPVDEREEQGRTVIEAIPAETYDIAALVLGITGENRHEAIETGPRWGRQPGDGSRLCAGRRVIVCWRLRKATRNGRVSPAELAEVRAKLRALIG